MGMLPAFPDFVELRLEHRALLEDYFRLHPPLISELTFTNLFAWREIYHYQLCRFRDGYLVRKTSHGVPSLLQPLVVEDPAGALRESLNLLQEISPAPAIERVGEDIIARLGDAAASFDLREDRDDYDYLYNARELIDLPGRRFHNKKNLLNQFQRTVNYRFLPMTAEHVEECLHFSHEWCREKRCKEDVSLSQENCAVVQMLEQFSSLGAVGGVLEIDGHVKAFTLGEPLNTDTFVIHVEKAAAGYTGIYQTINWEFVRHAAETFTYINREQDLGYASLRKAKESYNPVRMIKKYRVAPRTY